MRALNVGSEKSLGFPDSLNFLPSKSLKPQIRRKKPSLLLSSRFQPKVTDLVSNLPVKHYTQHISLDEKKSTIHIRRGCLIHFNQTSLNEISLKLKTSLVREFFCFPRCLSTFISLDFLSLYHLLDSLPVIRDQKLSLCFQKVFLYNLRLIFRFI